MANKLRKNWPGRKQARQESAEKREDAREARTVQEQLALLRERPGNSHKEFVRLMAQLTDDEKEQVLKS